ncbi:MAG: phospholipid carrier-dependent glycosyltransferase [Elusimicrobia bacterium]|nr:phospholipid carrier-dependent glycosyltransferase [Elusimicrobiota bacterium]MBD3412729.1 phospholipid carrier-dependent glycosyltransferase [Elusimicrobiota bacterium]
MKKSSRLGLTGIILAFVLPFVLRLRYIGVPLERDEGAYAYGAWRMIAGDLLYRDLVDFTPPGIFYIYAIARKLFGSTASAIRIGTGFYMLAVLACMFFLVKRITGTRTAWIATAILGVISASPTILGFTANKETFLLLPIIAAWYWYESGTRENSYYKLFLSGCAAGIGLIIKQVLIFFAVALFVCSLIDLWNKNKNRISHGLYGSLLFGLGVLVPGILIIGYYAMRGALSSYIYWVFVYPFEFGSVPIAISFGIQRLWDQILAMGKSDLPFWVFGAGGLYIVLKEKSNFRYQLLVLGASLCAGVCAGMRFRPHYFIILTPVIALISGIGINAWFEYINTRLSKTLRLIITLCTVIWLIGQPFYALRGFASASGNEISRRIYGANPFVESPTIADYIAKTTPVDETIFVMGSEPQIYFYAKRKNPTRHLFFYPLTAQYGTPRAFQEDVVKAVQKARPFYIIMINLQTSLYASEPSTDRYVFDELGRMIEADYRFNGYVLIGRTESLYMFDVDQVDPRHARERIPITIFKRIAQ